MGYAGGQACRLERLAEALPVKAVSYIGVSGYVDTGSVLRFFKTPVSSVCLIAKNEAPYLMEWIAYYRVLGFDSVIVYENNSTDRSAELLSVLAKSGAIKYRPWTLGANESPQVTAYTDALDKAKTEWMFFVDADEFLVLHKHPNVNAFLADFDKQPDIDQIAINWRLFGDSGLEGPDGRLVTERFTHASEQGFVVNKHLKSFIRVGKIKNYQVGIHMSPTKGETVHASGRPLIIGEALGLSEDIEYDVAQINHYYTKTLIEYQLKKTRGQGGAGDNQPELKYWYTDDVFHLHNRNEVADDSISRLMPALKAEISRLEKIFTRS